MVKEMKKIVVIGCPGSGKSTFSRELHCITGIPLYHLDMMFWNSDKTTVERNIFMERLNSVLQKDEWIIDGNYASSMEQRIVACDMIVFLDYPLATCLEGISQRRGKARADIPWIETEDDEEFIEFIKKFNEEQRPLIINLLEKYKNKNILVFSNRKQANAYLKGEGYEKST